MTRIIIDSPLIGITNNTFQTSLGFGAGTINTGPNNVFIGLGAGANNTTGGNNTFIGNIAGYNNTTGNNNTFTGYTTGPSTTSPVSDNTYIGAFTGDFGNSNTYIGNSAGGFTSGNNNTYIGYSAALNNFIGTNTYGATNTYIGYQAGFSTTTGSGNICIGFGAGYGNQSGNSSIFIGTFAGSNESSSNKLYIANTSTTIPLIGGDLSTQTLGINVPVNPPPNSTLTVGGSISLSIILTSSSITLTSANFFVKVDTTASTTITLPDATICTGRIYEIMKIVAANTLTLATTSSQTINLSATKFWTIRYTSARVISDGASWIGNLISGS